jgi:arginine repressor
MEKWERVGCFFFLLVGITVFFGLSSAGCTKESTQTGLPGSQSSTGGQGYPSTSTGPQGYPTTSTGGQGYPSTSTGQQISQAYQGSTFAKTISWIADNYARSVIQSSDGGYVVAGDFVVKLDSLGNIQWSKIIGGYAYSIIQSSDGGYVVAGGAPSFESFEAGGRYNLDMYVVKLDSSGNVQWTKTIGGSAEDLAESIIRSSDGGYVVAGWTESFGSESSGSGEDIGDIFIVKLDSSGNVQWAKTIGGASEDRANSIIQSSDGGYVVAGWTASFGAGYVDIFIVKLDSSGNVVWTKTIGGSSDDRAYSITQSSDGGYAVAGFTTSFGAGKEDMYVVKLDSSGNVQWAKTIGRSSWDYASSSASSIIQSSDGGYVIAGGTDILVYYSGGSSYYSKFYVVKTDSNLNVCFSQNVTSYLISVSSNVGSFSSPSAVAISQSPTVNTVSPNVEACECSVIDVCALAKAPHLCSESQDCDFSSALVTNGEKENVKSYGCSAGGIFSRFLIPASMLIVYGWLRKKRKKC